MELFLSIVLIAAILVTGVALWQAFGIIKKGKAEEKLSEGDTRKVGRWFNVVQACVYIIVVIAILRFCLKYLFI